MAAKNPAVAYPLLALCCFGFILAAIAIVIVLALIPLYTNTAQATLNSVYDNSRTITVPVSVSDSVPSSGNGDVDDTTKSKIADTARSAMSNEDKSNVDFKISSAKISDTSARKRAIRANGRFLIIVFIIYGRSDNLINIFIQKLLKFIDLNPGLFSAAVSGFTTTTISPSVINTTPLAGNTTSLAVNTTPLPVSTTPLPVSTTPLPVSTTPLAVSTTPSPVSATPSPVSATPAGRRRRRNNDEATTPLPLVTYRD